MHPNATPVHVSRQGRSNLMLRKKQRTAFRIAAAGVPGNLGITWCIAVVSSIAPWHTSMYFRSHFEAKAKPAMYSLEGPKKTDPASRDPPTHLRIAQMAFRRLRRIYILFFELSS